MFKNIKYFFNLIGTVKKLENDIEDLEYKVLAPKKKRGGGLSLDLMDLYLDRLYLSGSSKGRRNITLEEKVDALAEALDIRFGWSPEAEAEPKAYLPKKDVKKEKPTIKRRKK